MTNAEKFKEVFGYEIEALAPDDPCNMVDHDICIDNECDTCPLHRFWEKEYKNDNTRNA